MRISQKMPAFQGVGAGQTATMVMPLGLSYHDIWLTYANATLAQINEIRLVINGKVEQRYIEAAELDKVNQFDGGSAAGGILRIPVGDRYGMLTRQGREFAKLGTGRVDDSNPITSMQLEVDIDAGALGVVANSLSAIARQSAPDVSGMIKKTRNRTYNPAGAGEFQIADLTKGLMIEKLILSGNNILSVKIERDRRIVFERTKAQNELIQTEGARVPQAGKFIIDMAEDGFGAEFLETAGVQDFRVFLEMSGAEAVGVETIEYGPVGA